MINHLMAYFLGLKQSFVRPQTYGSALEDYITSNNPKTPQDIDRLQRAFDQQLNKHSRWGI